MKIFDWPRDESRVRRFFARAEEDNPEVEKAVAAIIRTVRAEGDAALVQLTRRLDKARLKPSQFELSRADLEAAWRATPPRLQSALRLAARRIRAFHEHQRLKGWVMHDRNLGRMEMRVQPIERAGVYAPGGKAAYPSTVLMDVIPAKVAGVDEVILTTPPGRNGMPEPIVLAAAYISGVDRVFRIGGAQAIAAMAYGTKTVPRVDKIVGPGNIYVATAKRQLFGQIGIESVAGPTEVLILADDSVRLDWIAADLLAQAEHDEGAAAGAVLIGMPPETAKELYAEIRRQSARLPRRAIADEAIRRGAFIIRVKSEEEAAAIANLKAPEHVQVMTRNARRLARRIRHAGAIFIGPHTPEPVGDYIAGPNHTLPTGGTARFFSPLSVWTFLNTSHTIEATREGLARHASAIEALATAEGLTAHAESVRIRSKPRRPRE